MWLSCVAIPSPFSLQLTAWPETCHPGPKGAHTINIMHNARTHTHTGTVLAFEKEPNILKEEHRAVMEAVRDVAEKDFKEYLATH